MPGKPSSPNIGQKQPYVIQMHRGRAVSNKGVLVDPGSVEAHIPVGE